MPFPRRNSGRVFKIWATNFGHAVEHANANPGFCSSVFESARFTLARAAKVSKVRSFLNSTKDGEFR